MDASSTFSPTTGSLPRPLTSLIGREREMAEVADLLCRNDVQLVTLTGPGGVGKTRLAIAAATSLAASFPGGIWFVDLAPVRDSSLVIASIADAVGARSGSPSVTSIFSTLEPQSRYLLLLDNFEHVVEAAPLIGRLLAGAPLLSTLVTSREPLKIGGEWEFQVPPLTGSADGLSTGEIGQHDAIRLFVARAQAVDRTFALGDHNLAVVAEICRRVDGLPLAIELAAARVKILPPAALLARLEHLLPLLATDRRDMPERQHTMRDAIAWSYRLLSPSEQVLFRRLGVFVGGCQLDAIEAIASIVAGYDGDTLHDLSSLVDKSLVRLSTGAGPDPRYQLLETIREFAAEQLAASDEHCAVRDAHAAWFTQVAEERRRHGDIWTEPKGIGKTLSSVETDYGNVRAALVWLDESNNLSGLARIAGSIFWYWTIHGPRSEGLRWLRRAREARIETEDNKRYRTWVLEGLSLLARDAGAIKESIDACQECQRLAQEIGDILAEASAKALLGYIALGQGDYDQADALYRKAIDLRKQSAKGWSIATAQINIGLAAHGRGDLSQAERLYQESLIERRRDDDTFDVAVILGYLSLIRSEQTRYPEAASVLLEALPNWQKLNNQENISEWLLDVGVIAEGVGQADAGARFAAAASTVREAVSHALLLPERAIYERTETSLRSSLGENAFAIAWQDGADMSLHQAIAEASAFLKKVQDPSHSLTPDRRANPFGLTARELDVLRLLVRGQSDKEIAEALFIGTRTIETHVSNLLAKLEAHNRAEAAALAVRHSLV